MTATTTGALLRLGLGAARRQGWLLVPLSVAEIAARLLSLLVSLYLLAAIVSHALRLELGVPALAMLVGTLQVFTSPEQVVVLLLAVALALAGGWLVKLPANAGAAQLLARQAGHAGVVERRAFDEGLLSAPERWLSTAGLALVLRLVATVGALGAVVAGMAYFQANPGPLAALLMTIATLAVVLLPTLDAALDLGFVRAVLFDEGPAVSLGTALVVARRHASQLIPAWFLFLLAELAIGVVAGVMDGVLGALPRGEGRWVLVLGPRAFVWLAAAIALACVGLGRLGVFAALVADDAGLVPPPPSPQPPPLPEEPVLEAVAVAPADAVLPADAVDSQASEQLPAPSDEPKTPPAE